MPCNSEPTLLVTGASSYFGRRVIATLIEAKAGRIIAATPNPASLTAFAKRGVIIRYADFDKPVSLAKAFIDVDRMLMVNTDTFDIPGRRLRQQSLAIKVAEKIGIKHMVYTSLTNPSVTSPIMTGADHYGTEVALAESCMGFTILRNNIFMDRLLIPLRHAVQTGQFMTAEGHGKTGYVSFEDCVYAAVAALTASFSGRRVLDITGSEALSTTELANLVSAMTDKHISRVALETAQLIEHLVASGLSRPLAQMFVSFDNSLVSGTFDVVSDALEHLINQKPMNMRDFLIAHQNELLESVPS